MSVTAYLGLSADHFDAAGRRYFFVGDGQTPLYVDSREDACIVEARRLTAILELECTVYCVDIDERTADGSDWAWPAERAMALKEYGD